MTSDTSYPTIKTIEGWVQYASDYEYGDTPVIYIGEKKGFSSIPYRGAKTDCEVLSDDKWEELWLTPEYYGSDKAWRVKITVEIFEEREIEEKTPW